MKINKRKEFIYKSIGDIKEDDEVLTPDGKKHKVFSIQEQGNSDIYKIYISDGRIFRTHQKHLTPVCFRQKNGEEIWDCLTTEWMQKYIDRFHFTIIDNYSDLKVDDKYSLFYEHEAEPDDNIEPIIKDGPYIIKIEKLNYSENCRCISLFDPEGLYYTNNGIITHNSTISVLIQLFISTHYALMWHPWKYFNLAPSSVFTQCLGAWNQKKASELLLEPFVQILEQSPYFKRVRSHTDLVDAGAADLTEHLCWTTSTPTAQPLDSKIIMADNSIKTMGEIKIGDKIKSPSEGVTEVINIPFHGIADCYEIELEDGRKVRCSAEHLWKVRKSPTSEWEVQNLKFIMEHPEFDWEIIELDDFDAYLKVKNN